MCFGVFVVVVANPHSRIFFSYLLKQTNKKEDLQIPSAFTPCPFIMICSLCSCRKDSYCWIFTFGSYFSLSSINPDLMSLYVHLQNGTPYKMCCIDNTDGCSSDCFTVEGHTISYGFIWRKKDDCLLALKYSFL